MGKEMKGKKEREEQLTSCSHCGASVKEKNLSRHLQKVHGWRMRKEERAKAKSMRHDRYTVRKGRTMKLALLTVGLLAVLSASVYAYINSQGDVVAPSTVVYEDPETGYVSNLTVKLLDPSGGETLSGIVDVRWQASGGDKELQITIQYSTDPPPWCAFCPRQTWHDLATSIENDGVFEWDTTQFSDGGYTLKVLASDGTSTAEYRSGVFTIKN